jgi:hypothetical protein
MASLAGFLHHRGPVPPPLPKWHLIAAAEDAGFYPPGMANHRGHAYGGIRQSVFPRSGPRAIE